MIQREAVARYLKFLIVACAIGADPVLGQMHHHEEDAHGQVDFPVSCQHASQAEFNKAVTLLHHMTYPQARAMFQKIAAQDSGCAMAYWGIAMTLFQPLWPTRPGPHELEQGFEAITKAESLNPPTQRERLLIAAAGAFFQDPKSGDYWKRIHAWAEGMRVAYERIPEDHEVAAFYALALVATVPPDQISSPNNAQAADILLRILKDNPDHPGAMHYLIHANDAPRRERESLDVLSRYAAIAPHNPHALHMPTHIYTRLGNWPEVIRGNIQAADAALEFPAGDQGQYVWDEFPHAIEYLIYAYLQTGEDDAALKQLKRLQGTAKLEPTFKTAFHLASTKARYALERKAWNEAASIVPREPASVNWDRYPWPEAISWFARGLGSVHTGHAPEARTSLARLVDLEGVSTKASEVLFSRHIRVLRLELSGLVAGMEGAPDSSIVMMTQAIDLEASTPKHAVTPAPTLPACELLGDLLLEQGKPSEARKAYERSLEVNPSRFNSLLGAARAARASADVQAAATFYRKLVDGSSAASKREGLQEAREFLSK